MSAFKLFTCTSHDQHYPVGAASIVIARDADHACTLLDAELVIRGLKPRSEESYELEQVDTSLAKAIVLNDGNY